MTAGDSPTGLEGVRGSGVMDPGAGIGGAAAALARAGYTVLPLIGKAPLTKRGFRDASRDPAVLARWWSQWPDAGVGIATGEASRVWVLDVDGEKGAEALHALESEHSPLPETVKALTRKGWHLYFRMAEGTEVRNSASRVGPGLDVRGNGGYVVAPPSPHPDGGSYRWEASRGPDGVAVADAPAWLLELAVGSRNGDPIAPATDGEGQIPEGQRNATLVSYAGSMRRRGLEREEILPGLAAINARRCQPPLPAEELEQIVRSIGRYRPQGKKPEHRTDLGNARRLVIAHGEEIRYAPYHRRWLVWDGRRWALDVDGEVVRRAKDTVRSIYREAAEEQDPERRKSVASWAARSESAGQIRAMIFLAETEPEIPVSMEDLDADRWQFNVRNGTIDLRTGELRPHEPGDLITRVVDIQYDPEGKAPKWDAFLSQVAGEVKDFLQRAVGYSLTGSTTEQVLFLLYGTGQNGKSVFLELVREIMGEYAKQADMSAFLTSRGDRVRNDIARLAGARFVSAVESNEGAKLDEALVKRLTGGDTVAARFLYQESFEFKPQFKPWIAANHKPEIRGTDQAIWRRVCLVPFTYTVPEKERNRGLAQELRGELPGILAWAVQGCLEWQRNGLQVPDAIRAATASYREEMDPLSGFLDDQCVREERAIISAQRLYNGYVAWAEANGEESMTKTLFGRKLRERGIRGEKMGASRLVHYAGIRVRDGPSL